MRYSDSHRKFLLGLSFEKASLTLVKNDYLDSESALRICKILISEIEQNNQEHVFYKLGTNAFNSKQFMENKTVSEEIKACSREKWKKERYHNLVRLGGDILRSGLAEYKKATILGGLLFYKKNNL